MTIRSSLDSTDSIQFVVVEEQVLAFPALDFPEPVDEKPEPPPYSRRAKWKFKRFKK